MHIKQTNPFVVGFYLAGMCCRQLYLLPRLTLPTFLFASLPCPSMSIGFEADRSVVGVNEPVSITVVARNGSSSSVQSMHVEIVQVCRCMLVAKKKRKSVPSRPWPCRGHSWARYNERWRRVISVGEAPPYWITPLGLISRSSWPLRLELAMCSWSTTIAFLP